MLKIISNSCVGGFLYRDYFKCPFQTPFIWNLIDFNSMYYLIKNFENIDFRNYELVKDSKWNFSIIIENNIELKFIHYKFNAKANTILKKDIDVHYNKIWEYIVQKYKERLKRMMNDTSEPIFILANGHDPVETNLSYENLKALNDLRKDNIICAVNRIYPELSYIKQTLRNTGTATYGANPRLAKKIYNEFLK